MKIVLYVLSFVTLISATCRWSAPSGKGLFETKIICSNIDSNNIHQEVSRAFAGASYYEYIFENSSIQNFPMNVFTFKKGNVLHLYMNNSQIETIETGAFSGLLEVREIYLQFNSLNVISRGCFNSLLKLRILDLSNNAVYLIEEDVFNGSEDLRKILLNNNNITFVPRLIFHSLKQLQIVNLSNNKINTFDLSFTNFAVFKRIYLSNNQIGILNCTTLPTSYLDVIDLENNLLTEMNGACLPNIVEDLSVKNNALNRIINTSKLNNLKNFDLSENYIEGLNMTEFISLKKLESLKLQRNNLSELAPGIFKDLGSLASLNLSGNSIKLLDFGVFNGLAKLNNLDLSYNQLEVLEEDVFHNLNRLKVLNVSYNNLQYINLVKLKTYSDSLEQINLIGNNISCQKLSSMFSYRLNLQIVKSVYYNVSNVHGVPCTNFNVLLKKLSDSKVSNGNILREIRLFFDMNFKNTSFFKFFTKDSQSNNITSINNTIDATILDFQKYLKDRDLKIQDLDGEFNQIISQMSKSNTIFIILTLVVILICALLLTLIMLLKNKLTFRSNPLREPEMLLL